MPSPPKLCQLSQKSACHALAAALAGAANLDALDSRHLEIPHHLRESMLLELVSQPSGQFAPNKYAGLFRDFSHFVDGVKAFYRLLYRPQLLECSVPDLMGVCDSSWGEFNERDKLGWSSSSNFFNCLDKFVPMMPSKYDLLLKRRKNYEDILDKGVYSCIMRDMASLGVSQVKYLTIKFNADYFPSFEITGKVKDMEANLEKNDLHRRRTLEEISRFVQQLPNLEKLSLDFCSDGLLREVARHCPKLSYLKLSSRYTLHIDGFKSRFKKQELISQSTAIALFQGCPSIRTLKVDGFMPFLCQLPKNLKLSLLSVDANANSVEELSAICQHTGHCLQELALTEKRREVQHLSVFKDWSRFSALHTISYSCNGNNGEQLLDIVGQVGGQLKTLVVKGSMFWQYNSNGSLPFNLTSVLLKTPSLQTLNIREMVINSNLLSKKSEYPSCPQLQVVSCESVEIISDRILFDLLVGAPAIAHLKFKINSSEEEPLTDRLLDMIMEVNPMPNLETFVVSSPERCNHLTEKSAINIFRSCPLLRRIGSIDKWNLSRDFEIRNWFQHEIE